MSVYSYLSKAKIEVMNIFIAQWKKIIDLFFQIIVTLKDMVQIPLTQKIGPYILPKVKKRSQIV